MTAVFDDPEVQAAYNDAVRSAIDDDGTPGGFDEDTWPDGWDDEPSPESEVAPETFWSSRLVLQHIHNFARARLVAPWAVLGGVLTRVIAATEPNVQLPPTIGSHASLNLFAGLVGPSGAGKDAAAKVARDAVDLRDGNKFLIAPLGSGEGLSHMFMKEDKEGPTQYNVAALVTIGEIDTLSALVKRQSSTVGSQLRQAAMGEQLGFFYVDTSKRMITPEHRYRLCLIAGIQPKRAGALLDEADGGTPQRFIWLPATDPEAPDETPECPVPYLWVPPKWHEAGGGWQGEMYRNEVGVCKAAKDTITTAHRARLRGQGEALDGHALLTRLKVAAGLAILEGRCDVSDEDWDLSGLVMAISDRTRTGVVKVLAADQRDQNTRQAEAKAIETILVQERVGEATVRRVCGAIKRLLARAGDEGAPGGKVHGCVSGPDKPFVSMALSSLILAGDVVEQKIEYHGQRGMRYWLSSRAPDHG